jgi:hypothetical protein
MLSNAAIVGGHWDAGEIRCYIESTDDAEMGGVSDSFFQLLYWNILMVSSVLY